eukprot:4746109-Alexandrium_andersonii.AAC.1
MGRLRVPCLVGHSTKASLELRRALRTSVEPLPRGARRAAVFRLVVKGEAVLEGQGVHDRYSGLE